MKKKKYDESSIKVLKGLEPVKQRPGMYTRTDNPLHILQEVIDNSADEALSSYAQNIKVTRHTDGSFCVTDDGRGIPVGNHPNENISVLEIVFTRLHSGGKFSRDNEAAYVFSGGLHGVGVSVTNALSAKVEVRVWREGFEWLIIFKDGFVSKNLEKKDSVGKKTGTSVRLWPDKKYFDEVKIPVEILKNSLKARAVLLSGTKFIFFDEESQENTSWSFSNGLRDYFSENIREVDLVAPIWDGESFIENADDNFSIGEGAKWILAFTQVGLLIRESYVNLIPTLAGGTHESGFKEGIFQALKSFMEQHKLLPKGLKIQSEDIFSRANFLLSTNVFDPQFQGQTKEKLTNREVIKLVSSRVKDPFEIWLNQDVNYGKKIVDLVIKSAQQRQKNLTNIDRRKVSSVAVLPGKLTDCELVDNFKTEIFLVEGDSAGGSAKMGRDKSFQAILPLRGKVLNTWESDKLKLFANAEIRDISTAIGVDPHEESDDDSLVSLRYGKVCILADADVDGSHIQVLLLTLFFRHFPKLIEKGHVFVARPPLYRVDVQKKRNKPQKKMYALDDNELKRIVSKLNVDGYADDDFTVSRFKGLGEMNAEQLWETTLNPDSRKLMVAKVSDTEKKLTFVKLNMLMSKGESISRRLWIEKMGDKAEIDI